MNMGMELSLDCINIKHQYKKFDKMGPAMKRRKISPTTTDEMDIASTSLLIETLSSIDTHVSYDLHETDWMYVCDYLDPSHSFPLYCFSSSSSNGILGATNKTMEEGSWVLILHHVNVDIQEMVFEMVQHGRNP